MATHESDSHASDRPLRLDDGGPVSADDAREIRRLFDAHVEELTRYAYRYLKSIEESKDVVHDAFFRLWCHREEINPRAGARAYLYTTVRNLALDHLRRRGVEARWRGRVRESAGDDALIAPDDPDRDLAISELSSAVREAVAALPVRQREVLLLRWHRQADYDEIARTLGISPKTVSIHVGRAFVSLRKVLARFRRPDAAS